MQLIRKILRLTLSLLIAESITSKSCDDFKCLNGGTCKTISDDVFCDCSKAVINDVIYSGIICEYPHTTACGLSDINKISEYNAFCANNGECVTTGGKGKTFSCTCSDIFKGEHCQFDTTKIDVNSPVDNAKEDGELLGEEADESDRTLPPGMIILISSIGVAVFSAGGYMAYRWKIQDIVLDKDILKDMDEEKWTNKSDEEQNITV